MRWRMLRARRVVWLMGLFAATTAIEQISVSVPALVVDRSGQPGARTAKVRL